MNAFPVSMTQVKPQYWQVAIISPGLKLMGAPQLEHRISRTIDNGKDLHYARRLGHLDIGFRGMSFKES
jgi:hypothetical protein